MYLNIPVLSTHFDVQERKWSKIKFRQFPFAAFFLSGAFSVLTGDYCCP